MSLTRRTLLLAGVAPAMAAAPLPPSFQGLAWVSERGRTVFSAAQGLLHPGGPLLRPDSLWRWASITKLVTAVLVLQALAAGRWRLDQSIGDLWPGVPLPHLRPITLRQLLSHHSGLAPVSPDPGFWRAADRGTSRGTQADALLAAAAPPAQAPGSGFNYNNADFLLLGALLERLHGMGFGELVQQRIVRPIGLRGVGLYRSGETVPATHAQGADGPLNPARYGASGGLYGNAAALAQLAHALLQGRLLDAASWAELKTANAYGAALGVWRFELPGLGEVVERQGWIGGLRSLLLMQPSRDRVVIVCSTNPEEDLSSSWKGEGLGVRLLTSL